MLFDVVLLCVVGDVSRLPVSLFFCVCVDSGVICALCNSVAGMDGVCFNVQALEVIAARGVPIEDMVGNQKFKSLWSWPDFPVFKRKFSDGAHDAGWEMKEVRPL